MSPRSPPTGSVNVTKSPRFRCRREGRTHQPPRRPRSPPIDRGGERRSSRVLTGFARPNTPTATPPPRHRPAPSMRQNRHGEGPTVRRSHHAFAGGEHTTETVQTGPKMNRFECVKVPALIRSRRPVTPHPRCRPNRQCAPEDALTIRSTGAGAEHVAYASNLVLAIIF